MGNDYDRHIRRFRVPKYVPVLVIIPIKKAPQNAKYSALRGILSAGSGGRTRTSHWKIADCDVIMPISVPIHIVFADFGM